MSYETSNYAGDATYTACCTGDAVVGDEVRFEKTTFTGGFRNAQFSGFEKITGKIVKDSYGADRQQHTFTIALEGGGELRIKGRNLYANGTYRKLWADESSRQAAANEKHARGNSARAVRAERVASWYPRR